jgi:acyl-CoA thioesterase
VSFVGPVVTAPLRLAPTVLREGSAVTHVEARVLQRGEPRCTVQVAFGAPRASSIALGGAAPPTAPGPDGLPELPYLPGLVPAFTRHFAYRLAAGALPFSGARAAEIGGWIRFRGDPSPAGVDEQAVALLDAWPPPVLALLSAHAPASSLAWTIELVRPFAPLDPRGWWYYHAIADAAEGGYAHSHATLWGPDGQVFALGRQSVSVFG